MDLLHLGAFVRKFLRDCIWLLYVYNFCFGKAQKVHFPCFKKPPIRSIYVLRGGWKSEKIISRLFKAQTGPIL